MAKRGKSGETGYVSVEIPSNQLVNSIKEKLCCHCCELPEMAEKCIWRVPNGLRSCNKKAYDPKIISIGPYHHGKKELNPMEKIKSLYLRRLLDRLPRKEETLPDFVEEIRELQSCAEGCYEDKYEPELVGDKFVEMLILDGCFLVELFRNDSWKNQPHKEDPVFTTPWILPNLYHDLILLENQIPWAVLLRLFQLSGPAEEFSDPEEVLAECVLRFFDKMMLLTEPAKYRNGDKIKHVLNLLHNCLVSSANTVPDLRQWELFPPVTDLLLSGVKLKKGNPSNILNIKFNNGVLEIPPIRVRRNSESLSQNLIAYEECNHLIGRQFTSYAVLLDCLVNTGKDAESLCDKGIIVDALSTEAIAHFCNSLYNETLVSRLHFWKLTEDLNKYYRSRWARWRYTLMSKHFKSSWSILSVVAAICILLLTFTQTLFAIFSS